MIGLMDRDPTLSTDRLTSALIEFPGGRQLSFLCSTQLVPHQRVQIAGTKGRIEVQVPFNPKPDDTTRVLVDDGSDLRGSGIAVEEIPPCDQYTLQGDEFSRVVLGDKRPDWPLEDAVANMKVIDAIFRSVEPPLGNAGAVTRPGQGRRRFARMSLDRPIRDAPCRAFAMGERAAPEPRRRPARPGRTR